jgi:hypothetical protein
MGHLFSCICPCFKHWVTSPLWVACLVISAHAFSTGPQVLYGSLVQLAQHCICPCFLLSALGHKSSMGRLFYCICPCLQHWITSPLWVACSVVSVHALSTGSQVLYGSLVLHNSSFSLTRAFSLFLCCKSAYKFNFSGFGLLVEFTSTVLSIFITFALVFLQVLSPYYTCS